MMPSLDSDTSHTSQPGATPQQQPQAAAQLATADYVMDLSAELSGMARGAGLELLSYLLDLVQLEAKRIKGHPQL